MQRHTDAALAALAGFVLTGLVTLPPALQIRAEKAARIAAYEQDLGPNTTSFGSDRAVMLASLLRDSASRTEAQDRLAEASGTSPQPDR